MITYTRPVMLCCAGYFLTDAGHCGTEYACAAIGLLRQTSDTAGEGWSARLILPPAIWSGRYLPGI